MSDQERRGPGRPRIWASEAERKRAYRARRVFELAEPARVRAEAQQLRAQLTAVRADLKSATARASAAEQRATRAETREARAVARIKSAERRVQRLRMDRDEARRLLKRKLALAVDAHRLRDDPDALIAIVAEQRKLLDWYRRQRGTAKVG